MTEAPKAPFPWFGGKRKVAALVWSRLGDVNNYIEPFAGSLAVLLCRPHPPRIETVNDLDCYVSNFWRSTSHDPEEVAEHADWPVSEADLHARHRWLVLSGPAAEFRQQMRTDPDYYDARIAGWWCWGLCCWIGAGWCAVPGETDGDVGAEQERRPMLSMPGSQNGRGILKHKLPQLGGCHATEGGAAGIGVQAKPKRPKLSGGSPGVGSLGCGVHANGPCTPAKIPKPRPCGLGMHADAGGRPQLANAYSRGSGVLGNDAAETCAARRAWLLDWFSRLRDRLRTVRVCCGDWRRVCSSDSVTVRLGTTGVFLDPPYGEAASRCKGLYATDSLSVADDVRAWCLEHGPHPAMRIALCGYAGEHEALEAAGWECVPWKAHGGYGNRSEVGKANAARERIWFSPHCQSERTLFSQE